jgi:WD40 repeat protein
MVALSVSAAQADDDDDWSDLDPLWRAAANVGPALWHDDEDRPAAISPDGRTVAVCWERRVDFYDAVSGLPLRQSGEHPFTTYGVSWSPDGKLVAVTMLGAGDGYDFGGEISNLKPEWRRQSDVYLWQTDDGSLRGRCVGHQMHVVGSVFSPDSSRLLTFGKDNSMRLWDVADGREVGVFETRVIGGALNRRPARLGAFMPDGTALITSQQDMICTRDPWDGWRWDSMPTACDQVGSPCASMAVSKLGKLVYCSRESIAENAAYHEFLKKWEQADREGKPLTYDAPSKTVRNSLLLREFVPSKHRYRSASGKDNTPMAELVDPHRRPRILDDQYHYYRPMFSDDGKWLCVMRFAEPNQFELTAWDATTWRLKQVHRENNGRYASSLSTSHFAFTPDSRYLTVGGPLFWNMETGQWSKSNVEGLWARHFQFSRDGKRLLTLADDHTGTFAVVSYWEFAALERTLRPTKGP